MRQVIRGGTFCSPWLAITRASCQESTLSLGMLSWMWKNGRAPGLQSCQLQHLPSLSSYAGSLGRGASQGLSSSRCHTGTVSQCDKDTAVLIQSRHVYCQRLCCTPCSVLGADWSCGLQSALDSTSWKCLHRREE